MGNERRMGGRAGFELFAHRMRARATPGRTCSFAGAQVGVRRDHGEELSEKMRIAALVQMLLGDIRNVVC